MSADTVLQTDVPGVPCYRGKVRDVYDLGDRLAIVVTDRISAFDWVMPNGIPGNGRILTAMTKFWLQWLNEPNHLISDNVNDLPESFRQQRSVFEGRTMLVRKSRVIPIECVARGYLVGSGWNEYQQLGTVCGLKLPTGLRQADKLPQPIFTPATKAEQGLHDENIPYETMASHIGDVLSNELRTRTLSVYQRAAQYAASRGVIIADTKLEWGQIPNGDVILIDEVLTPDSSRFWPAESYIVGTSPPSYDKQFLRNWLETTGWDKNSPPPQLPNEVIQQTAAKYAEALAKLASVCGYLL